jgi:hypothetical protein
MYPWPYSRSDRDRAGIMADAGRPAQSMILSKIKTVLYVVVYMAQKT